MKPTEHKPGGPICKAVQCDVCYAGTRHIWADCMLDAGRTACRRFALDAQVSGYVHTGVISERYFYRMRPQANRLQAAYRYLNPSDVCKLRSCGGSTVCTDARIRLYGSCWHVCNPNVCKAHRMPCCYSIRDSIMPTACKVSFHRHFACC